MISVIVCSANSVLLEKLRSNIEATIGCEYEILAFDNREIKKGISTVYNEQAAKATHQILCFLHEDVIIHSREWGAGLQKLLSLESVGLVGISGAVYKSRYPGSWATCHPSLYRTNSIQHFKNESRPINTNINPDNATAAQVAVMDGVFMATLRDIFDQYKFDEKILKGFHGYDIDYSLQVGQRYKVLINYDLLLEHLSEGALNQDWLCSTLLIHKKWNKTLPKRTILVDLLIKRQSDYQSCRCALGVALQKPGNKKLVLRYFFPLLFKYFSFNKFLFSKTVIYYLMSVKKSQYV